MAVDFRPALIAAYRALTADTRARALRHAEGLWIGMDSWSNTAADQLLADLLPTVIGAERATAATTAAFLTQYQETPARDAAPVDLTQVTGPALRGVPPEQVYRRPVIEARATYARLRKQGLNRDQLINAAVDAGLRRLLGTVGTDLQLAATHTADHVLTRTGVTTYRRVTRAGACPLCVAASDRVYTVGDLLPIHTNCHCIVVPGPVLPSSLQRASNTDDPPPEGRGLQIGDNGEIGPVLEYDQAAGTSGGRGKRTRPRPAATISNTDRRAMKQAQLDGYEKVIADGGGTPWMRDKANQLRAELGADVAHDAIGKRAGAGGAQYPVPSRAPRTALQRQPSPIKDRIELSIARTSPTYRTIKSALDVVGRVHGIPRGPTIKVSTRSLPGPLQGRHRAGMIEVDPDGPVPSLTFVHELFHALDDAEGSGMELQELTVFLQTQQPGWKTAEDDAALLAYLTRPDEMLARAYAQWIAVRAQDPTLLSEVNIRIGAGHWAPSEFRPIARRLDIVFTGLSWRV